MAFSHYDCFISEYRIQTLKSASCSAYAGVHLEGVRVVMTMSGCWNGGCCGLGSERRESHDTAFSIYVPLLDVRCSYKVTSAVN